MKNFKKILAAFLVASLLVGFSVSVISSASEPEMRESTVGEVTYVYQLNDDDTITIIEMKPIGFYSPEVKEIRVPETIDGHTVTAFGCNDRYMRTALNVKFPNLTDIYFPETITTLKPGAFWSLKPLIFHFNEYLGSVFNPNLPQPGECPDNTLAAFMAVSEYFIIEYKGLFYKFDAS